MRLLRRLPLLLLAAAISAAPTVKDDTVVVTRNFFLDTNVKHTGQHDIVNIIVPSNKINYDDDIEFESDDDITVFFVEADVNDKGERKDQGLYLLKNGTATKILDNGRDATTFLDDSNIAYIGASDGIYVYDDTNGSISKYGSLTDNIIQIEADNKTGAIYILTNDHQVFSVADNAAKKNKVEDLNDIKEIAIDFNSNLYYYDSTKDLYVFNQNGVKKIEGIPKRSEIKLVRPMFVQEEGVFAIVDNELYLLNPSGTADKAEIVFKVKPTAYPPEGALMHYFAIDKKMFKFNGVKFASEHDKLEEFLTFPIYDYNLNEIRANAA